VLMRPRHVRVREISARGCLLRVEEPMAAGSVGLIEIEVDGEPRVEAFRVCRAQVGGAAGALDVAVEFLPVLPPGARTVRGTMTHIEHFASAGPDIPPAAGTKVGDPRTSEEPAEGEAPGDGPERR
jgi:hypothetical protein